MVTTLRPTSLVMLTLTFTLAAATLPWGAEAGGSGAVAAGVLALVALGAPRLMRAQRLLWLRGGASPRRVESLRHFEDAHLRGAAERGEIVESGECEVSVMFVDLRGYTELVEELRLEETFSLVTRYTEAVSRVVREHGGFVVEFNGDGVMAVFGAPVKLPWKERAAVEAAMAVLEVVAALPIAPGHRTRRLSAGIGIATGRAYLGEIRAAGRCVWGAVGTTTNLASRLERVSRALDAAIVTDVATRDAAGGDPRLVFYPKIPIRGLRSPFDLYALPREQEEISPPFTRIARIWWDRPVHRESWRAGPLAWDAPLPATPAATAGGR